jgi:adenylosuccinate lyase
MVDPNLYYDNPLIGRYASAEMSALWGPQRKFSTWRRLWVILAETQAELGLPITEEQIEELRRHVDDIDYAAAERYERELRHDVMAHIRAYGDRCPQAKGILHLGATSCYVTDNTDLILIRESLLLLRKRLVNVIDALARFAEKWRDQPCLAFTHLQPAQPTTVGKRACLWAYDFVMDLEELEHRLATLKARGAKGTTGTQASFLTLFDGDDQKVEELDRRVTEKMGFAESYPVTGQTYPRKVDSQVLDLLSGIAQSAHKMATDLRILAHRKEIEEPFETKQVGSSAMPYKRNPMRCERICGLARFLFSLQTSGPMTAATQWLERTLDDSANRRLVLPQAFLTADAVLILCQNVVQGLVVYPRVIERNLRQELPFMATEEILMAAVARGGDRQELHERLRQHSHAAGRKIKEEGGENDLLERLGADPAFSGLDLEGLTDPRRFIGRAARQVELFLERIVRPIRQKYCDELGLTAEVKV